MKMNIVYKSPEVIFLNMDRKELLYHGVPSVAVKLSSTRPLFIINALDCSPIPYFSLVGGNFDI